MAVTAKVARDGFAERAPRIHHLPHTRLATFTSVWKPSVSCHATSHSLAFLPGAMFLLRLLAGEAPRRCSPVRCHRGRGAPSGTEDLLLEGERDLTVRRDGDGRAPAALRDSSSATSTFPRSARRARRGPPLLAARRGNNLLFRIHRRRVAGARPRPRRRRSRARGPASPRRASDLRVRAPATGLQRDAQPLDEVLRCHARACSRRRSRSTRLRCSARARSALADARVVRHADLRSPGARVPDPAAEEEVVAVLVAVVLPGDDEAFRRPLDRGRELPGREAPTSVLAGDAPSSSSQRTRTPARPPGPSRAARSDPPRRGSDGRSHLLPFRREVARLDSRGAPDPSRRTV